MTTAKQSAPQAQVLQGFGWAEVDQVYVSTNGRWVIKPLPGENKLWHLIDQTNPAVTLSAGAYPSALQAADVAWRKEQAEVPKSIDDELDEYITATKITDPNFAYEMAVGEVEDQLYRDMRAQFPNGDRTVQAQWASDMAPCIYRYIENAKVARGEK